MKRILALIVIICANPTYPILAWTSIDGPSAKYTGILTNADESCIIISLEEGGSWKSTDHGQSWTPLNISILNDSNFDINLTTDSFQLDADLDTVFIELGFSIAQSWQWAGTTDLGQTWLHFNPVPSEASYGHHLLVDRSNHDRLLLLMTGKIAVSDDFGTSWTDWTYDDHANQLFDVIQHPNDDSTFYAAGFGINSFSADGVYRSSDFCSTWDRLLDPDSLTGHASGYFTNLEFLSNGDLVAIAASMHDSPVPSELSSPPYLFSSSDNGGSWIVNDVGFPPRFFAWKILEDPHQNGSVYSFGWYNFSGTRGLYQSENFAQSFTRNPNGLPEDLFLVTNVQANPFNNTVYLCTIGKGIWKTADGGQSWQPFEQDLPFGRTMQFSVTNQSIFATGIGDPGLYHFDFSQDSWSYTEVAESNGDSLHRYLPVCLTSGGKMIVFEEVQLLDDGSTSFQTHESTDSGQTWTPRGPELTPGPDLFYSSHLPRTLSDTSKTWIAITRNTTNGWTADISPDSGLTWNTSSDWPGAVSFELGQNELFAISRNGVFSSTDDGESWNDLAFPNLDNLRIVPVVTLFDTSTASLFVFSKTRVYRYQNETWQSMSGYALPPVGATLIPGNPSTLLMVKMESYTNPDYQILTSRDQGASWTRIDVGPGTPAYAPQFTYYLHPEYDPWRNVVWVSTPLGFMYMDAELIVEAPEKPIHLHPQNHVLLSTYPNPFNETAKVTITLGRPGQVNIQVFDIQGRKITTLTDGFKQSGVYTYNLSAEEWPTGTYFVRFVGPNETLTKKITLVK